MLPLWIEFQQSWLVDYLPAPGRSSHSLQAPGVHTPSTHRYIQVFSSFKKLLLSESLYVFIRIFFFLLCDWIPASMPEWRIFDAGWNILLIRTVNAPVADELSLVIKLDDRILHVSIKTEHAEEQTDKKTDNIVIVSVLRVNLAGH